MRRLSETPSTLLGPKGKSWYEESRIVAQPTRRLRRSRSAGALRAAVSSRRPVDTLRAMAERPWCCATDVKEDNQRTSIRSRGSVGAKTQR
jgi:hypothetical protein